MSTRPLADLLTSVHVLAHQGELNTGITGITLYANQATAGQVFMTVRGLTRDGHQFIPQAIAHGAAAAIGDRPPHDLVAQGWLPPDFPYIQVTDARGAQAQVAAAYYGYPGRQLKIVGVTGTDGKTTTSKLVYGVLKAGRFRVGAVTTVSAMIGDQEVDTGFHTTTPDAPEVQRYLAQMVAAGMEVVVLETTSHGLDQKRVDAIDFDVAVVTNITHEHLDAHGSSLEAYRQAKMILFHKLSQSPAKPGLPKTAILNADDSSIAYLDPIPAERKFRYGVANGEGQMASKSQDYQPSALSPQPSALSHLPLDLYATDILTTPRGLQFTAHTPSGALDITSPLLGVYNVHNILAALGVGVAFGVAPAAMQAGIASVQGILGRMDPIDAGQDFLAVVDFAHTPNALAQALRAGREMLTQAPTIGPAGLQISPTDAPDGLAIHPTDYKSVGSGIEGGSSVAGRVIVVFGAAGLRDREKRRMMGEVAGQLADIVIITAEDPRTEDLESIMAESAAAAQAQGKVEGVDLFRVADRGEAIYQAVQMARAGDIVLACGKGHEQSMCFGTTEYPWSDHSAMRSALGGAPLATLPTSQQKTE